MNFMLCEFYLNIEKEVKTKWSYRQHPCQINIVNVNELQGHERQKGH